MKKLKVAVGLFCVGLGFSASNVSLAEPHGHHHGHGGLEIYLGPVWAYPRYYSRPYYYDAPPYYYSPPVVTAPPPVYMEQRDDRVESPAQSNAWYYCDNPQGYYPYVKQCPSGWEAVSPTPPSRERR